MYLPVRNMFRDYRPSQCCHKTKKFRQDTCHTHKKNRCRVFPIYSCLTNTQLAQSLPHWPSEALSHQAFQSWPCQRLGNAQSINACLNFYGFVGLHWLRFWNPDCQIPVLSIWQSGFQNLSQCNPTKPQKFSMRGSRPVPTYFRIDPMSSTPMSSIIERYKPSFVMVIPPPTFSLFIVDKKDSNKT